MKKVGFLLAFAAVISLGFISKSLDAAAEANTKDFKVGSHLMGYKLSDASELAGKVVVVKDWGIN